MRQLPYNRRRFLARLGATAAAGVAAPLFVPSATLGREALPAPSERITFGMIGTGRQACIVNMQRQLLRMPDAQVVALCDVDSWRLNHARDLVAQAYRDRKPSGAYRPGAIFEDYRDVLARQDVDAVMISTPDHWHAPMAIEAAAAGKHVALEKPITRTIAEGQAIVDAMRKHRRVFRMDSEMRSEKHLHQMAEIVRSGTLGRITAVRVGVPAGDDVPCPETPEMPVPKELNYELWQGPARRFPYTLERVHPPQELGRPGWMRVLDYSDGMVTNWGTHFWDIALWCIDAEDTGPVEVEGKGVWPEKGRLWNVLRQFEITGRMADGVELYYENTRNPAITGAVEKCTAYVKIEGTEGWIFAAYAPHVLRSEPASLVQRATEATRVQFPLKWDKQDFVDAIKEGGRTMENEDVAHRVTSLCHLGHIAVHLGEKLQWDAQSERFQGNDTANRYLDRPILEVPQG